MNCTKLLKTAAYTLISKERIEKVSLKDILAEAEVSKQTFYRYFADKYALANSLYDDLFYSPFFAGMQSIQSWRELYLNQFAAYRSHLPFVQHLFCSRETGCTTDHEIQNTLFFDRQCVVRSGGNPDDLYIRFALESKDVGGTYAMRSWILGGMQTDDKEMVHCFELVIPDILKNYFL